MSIDFEQAATLANDIQPAIVAMLDTGLMQADAMVGQVNFALGATTDTERIAMHLPFLADGLSVVVAGDLCKLAANHGSLPVKKDGNDVRQQRA
jgi:hypothetical protein